MPGPSEPGDESGYEPGYELGAVRVLVVEDEPDFLDVLTHHGRSLGYQCTEALTGAHAQAVLSEATFDLLILDMVLPGLSGSDLLRWFRDQDGGWATTVVAISILDPSPATVELADDVLIKPFRRAQLIAAIERAELRHNQRTPSRDTPSRDTPSRDTPSRDTPSRDTPSRDTPSRDTPSRDTPSRDTPTNS